MMDGTEAGRSLGLNYIDTTRFIVVPQAFKAILPSLGNEFIVLLKDTSLISIIGGQEKEGNCKWKQSSFCVEERAGHKNSLLVLLG